MDALNESTINVSSIDGDDVCCFVDLLQIRNNTISSLADILLRIKFVARIDKGILTPVANKKGCVCTKFMVRTQPFVLVVQSGRWR